MQCRYTPLLQGNNYSYSTCAVTHWVAVCGNINISGVALKMNQTSFLVTHRNSGEGQSQKEIEITLKIVRTNAFFVEHCL